MATLRYLPPPRNEMRRGRSRKNATLQRIMLDRFPETRGDQTPTRNRRESAAPSRSRYFPEAVAAAPAMGKELPSWLRTRPKPGLLLGSPSITQRPWTAEQGRR